MQRKLVKPRMITAPTSHLVHAFVIIFLTLLCPTAIMIPLVLLQCCFWVTHIHRVELESQSQKPVPSSMVMTPVPLSHPPALLKGEISEQQSEEKGFLWKRGVIWGEKRSVTCLFQYPCSFPSYIFSKHTVQFPGSIAQAQWYIGWFQRGQKWSVLVNLFPSHRENGEWLREDRILNIHCHREIERKHTEKSKGLVQKLKR